MNEPQAQAAFTYRQELVDSGLLPERVEALTSRYVGRKIRDRSPPRAAVPCDLKITANS
jgi:hypothetical protein